MVWFCFILSIPGLQFKTEHGQHILKNPLVITSLVEKVCLILILSMSRVFEIKLILCWFRNYNNYLISFLY